MISAILSGFLTRKLGRKSILLLGEMACFFSMLIIAILQTFSQSNGVNYASIVFIFIFMFSFGISLGPIVWIYNAEILPEKGVALATIVNWISAFIIGLGLPPLASILG